MPAQPDHRPADATLSVTKAAHVLGVHPNTVRAWSEQGRLRYYRINARGDRRYRVGDLRSFLAEAERGSGAGSPGHPADGHGRPDPRRAQPALPMPGTRLRGRPALPARADHRLDDGSVRGVGREPTGPAVRLAPGAVATAPGARQLGQLATLAASGRTLDAILFEAARLLRDATRATEVALWELRDDRLVRRAAASAGGRTGLPGHAGIAAAATAQRRPVVDVVGSAPDRGPAVDDLHARPATWGGSLPGARDDGAGRFALDVAVPIVTEGPWGAITVRLPALAAGDDAVAWLEAAAALLGAAVRSAIQMDEAARAIHRAEALRRVAMDTSGNLDLDETLGRILDHALVLFGADRGRILVGRTGTGIAGQVSRGLSPAYLAAVGDGGSSAVASGPSLAAEAVQERRPLCVMGYRDDPRSAAFRAAVVQEGFDTICTAPLLDGEDAIGMLDLCHDRPRPWLPADLETMAVFAAQATAAVRTSQQYADLARWAAQLQSIQQLGARLNRLTTVPEIASAMATELRVLIEYDNIRVYRLEGDDLIAVALHATDELYLDETPDEVRSRIGEGITGWVAAHGIAQNLPDSSVDPRTEDIPGSEAFDESMLLAPLIFEDRVLGVIALASRGLNRFGDDDLRLLEIYAGMAAQAMANADGSERLRAQSAALQRQLRSQRELLDITESILSTLDPRAVLDQIADRLGRLVRYDTLAIEVYDHRSGALVPLTAKGPDGEPDPHRALHDDLASWVIRHNEARLVRAAPTSTADRRQPAAGAPVATTAAGVTGSTSTPAASRILVPLRGRDGVKGVLALARTADVEDFTGDEFELVQLFAAQVSIALQNAETHRDVEVRARTDDLTGLLNHGSLRQWLARSAATGDVFSLIMLDLDTFKAVNDAFGHQAGDRLLSDISRAIVAAGRDSDLVFRYGGDEFAVLLPGTDAGGARHMAERIGSAVRAVARPGAGRDDVDISASIGVATYPQDASTGEDILLAADRACFVAKRGGRDRIADAAMGLALAAQFSLQEPTPVDSSDPRWSPPAESAADR